MTFDGLSIAIGLSSYLIGHLLTPEEQDLPLWLLRKALAKSVDFPKTTHSKAIQDKALCELSIPSMKSTIELKKLLNSEVSKDVNVKLTGAMKMTLRILHLIVDDPEYMFPSMDAVAVTNRFGVSIVKIVSETKDKYNRSLVIDLGHMEENLRKIMQGINGFTAIAVAIVFSTKIVRDYIRW